MALRQSLSKFSTLSSVFPQANPFHSFPLMTIDEEATIADALDILSNKRLHALPVHDANDKVSVENVPHQLSSHVVEGENPACYHLTPNYKKSMHRVFLSLNIIHPYSHPISLSTVERNCHRP
jgi:hypothetical protein